MEVKWVRALNSNDTASEQDSASPSFGVALAALSLVCFSFALLGVCFFAFCRCRKYWRSRARLSRLPDQRYHPDLLGYGTVECSICLSE